MNFEQSIKWQNDSVEAYISGIRASLGDSAKNDVIDAMESLYRAGWNDCYRLARLNGVKQYD